MRFKKYLYERIQNPPRDMRKYLQIKLKQADSIIKRLTKSIDVMKKIGNDDDVYSFSNEATYGEIRTGDVWEKGSSRDYGVLGYAMNVFYGGGASGLVGWLGDLLRELKREDNDRASVIDSIWRGLINTLRNEYEYDTFKDMSKQYIEAYEKNKQKIKQVLKDYVEYEDDSRKYKQYVEVLDSAYMIVKDIRKWYEDLQAKMIEADKARFYDYKPQTEDIETLYHATMYSKEILRKGFEAKTPADRIGLGGAVKGVSMTSDLKIAKDIARFLKEVIMIFEGKLKFRDIVDWMKREKIDVDEIIRGYGEPTNVLELAKFYEKYLWFSKIRDVPVTMWTDTKALKAFARRKASDVAILKCKVNMNNPNITYVKGEREYRVPPEAISSCEKL